jgi:hypothetical protein
LDGEELVREYRARFETEVSAEPPVRRGDDWHDRWRPPHRLVTVLMTVGGIMIGASAILRRGEVPPHSLDEPSTLSEIETRLPEGNAPASDPVAPEVSFANMAATDAVSLRLEIRLNGPCWVSAIADDERVVYRLMGRGDRTLIEARSAITLRVGDAGTVSYLINGMKGRPLGGSGEAVTVRITTDTLESLYAEPARAIPGNDPAARIG